jgi:hypothetical protein
MPRRRDASNATIVSTSACQRANCAEAVVAWLPVAKTHRRIWTSVVAAGPGDAAALVVGHGGRIEPESVACLPGFDYAGQHRDCRPETSAERHTHPVTDGIVCVDPGPASSSMKVSAMPSDKVDAT